MSVDHFLSTHPALVFVKVTDAQGSTPREAGAYMLVAPAAVYATIGGGHLEFLAIDKARDYMFERQAFGKALADFQVLQFKIADMATDLEAARLMIYRAADSLDRTDPDASKHSAMAKRYATDLGFGIVHHFLWLIGSVFPFIVIIAINRFVHARNYLRDNGVKVAIVFKPRVSVVKGRCFQTRKNELKQKTKRKSSFDQKCIYFKAYLKM